MDRFEHYVDSMEREIDVIFRSLFEQNRNYRKNSVCSFWIQRSVISTTKERKSNSISYTTEHVFSYDHLLCIHLSSLFPVPVHTKHKCQSCLSVLLRELFESVKIDRCFACRSSAIARINYSSAILKDVSNLKNRLCF